MVDEVIRSRVHYQESTGVLTHVTDQPSEDVILERNKQLRLNKGCMRDLGEGQEGGSWGRSIANIPFITYEKAIRDGYDLNSKDKDHRSKELFRFLNSPDGMACRTVEKI